MDDIEKLENKLEVTRKNFHYGLRLCQKKGVRITVQKCEYSLNNEFVVYTETWMTNPNPTISVFLSDVSDEDFLTKLEHAIEMFFEHIEYKKVNNVSLRNKRRILMISTPIGHELVLVKSYKTLLQWFEDLSLDDKLNLYNYKIHYDSKCYIKKGIGEKDNEI